MASLSECARERRGRALVLAAALAALAVLALALLWSRHTGASSALAPGVRDEARTVSSVGMQDMHAPAIEEGVRAEADASDRPTTPARVGGLVGRVLDERGLPIEGAAPSVSVAGPGGRRLAPPVDAAGGFGPLRLAGGTWTVSASAPGRRGASRTVEIARGEAPDPIELVLPRLPELAVALAAVGAGRGGDPARDLEDLRALLSLHLFAQGDEHVERRRVEAERTVFRPSPGRAHVLELCLGSERVLRQPLAADQSEVTLAVDPLDLWGRIVELDVELRDTSGAPLAGVTQALLAWESGAHLIAGQPGVDPSRAHFEVCPPGAARLHVVDVGGRRASADVVVPHAGPATLAVELELIEPERR